MIFEWGEGTTGSSWADGPKVPVWLLCLVNRRLSSNQSVFSLEFQLRRNKNIWFKINKTGHINKYFSASRFAQRHGECRRLEAKDA